MTLFWRCLLYLEVRVFGFALSHLSRYATLGKTLKHLLIFFFCWCFASLSFACAANQKTSALTDPEQNTPLAQGTVEAMVTPEPMTSSLTDKDSGRRAEVHELMLKGEYLHDGALELDHIGDISSVPALLVVLKENPPRAGGAMACTTVHALKALRKLTGANPGIRYEDWSAWWKNQKTQSPKEK